MTNPSLRRKFQRKFEQKADKPVYLPAKLGDGMGNVLTGTEGLVYIRVNDMPTTAVCTALPPVNDLPVWVYKPVFDPTRYYVQGQRIYGMDDPIQSGSDAHAEQHRYFGSGAKGGTDVLWVDFRQVLPLRIFALENTLQVGIIPWHVMIDNAPFLIGTVDSEGNYTAVTVDLTENIVTTEDKAKFVLITIDETGDVVATAGSEVDIDALDITTDLPAIPSDTRYVLGAVRLWWGQTQLEEGKSNTDIIDLRFFHWHRHDGAELTLDIGDLGDVTITDLGDGELLVSDSGSWVNKTLTEAGVAAASHNHDGTYSPVGHDHDSDYAPLSHVSDYDNPHQVSAGQLTSRWEVLTNSDPVSPELIFDENGDVLYVEVS